MRFNQIPVIKALFARGCKFLIKFRKLLIFLTFVSILSTTTPISFASFLCMTSPADKPSNKRNRSLLNSVRRLTKPSDSRFYSETSRITRQKELCPKKRLMSILIIMGSFFWRSLFRIRKI